MHWQQLPDPSLLQQQITTIENCLSGTFHDLLGAMLLDPALQISLNGPSNHRRNPNENLARELLELFSLGEGNYSESDVKEAARALSGYKLNPQKQIELEPRRHDAGGKTILGRNDSFNATTLSAWLCEQASTARHICRRYWRQTIGTSPTTAQLESLSKRWRAQRLSLPWLRSQLRTSPLAIESRRQGLRLADPMEMTTRSLRLIGSQHPEALALSLRGLRAMGQAPFEPPSVKGWPVNEQWLQFRWMQARRRSLQELLANEEIWESRQLPEELSASLTAIPPLRIKLPASSSRENLASLLIDPVWQLA